MRLHFPDNPLLIEMDDSTTVSHGEEPALLKRVKVRLETSKLAESSRVLFAKFDDYRTSHITLEDTA